MITIKNMAMAMFEEETRHRITTEHDYNFSNWEYLIRILNIIRFLPQREGDWKLSQGRSW